MAHSTPPPSAPGWTRWHSQPQSPEYGLLDGSFVQYDARATNTVTLQRPTETPHYLVGNAYTMAPTMAHSMAHTMAPSMAMPAPQYHGHQQYGFGCVTPQSPTSLLPSFRNYQEERPRMIGMEAPTSGASMSFVRDDRQTAYIPDQHQASNVKREQFMSPSSPAPMKDVISSKTITPTIAADPEKQTEFHTDVDTLMKTIQVKSEETTTTTMAIDHSDDSYPSPPHGTASPEPATCARNAKKRHPCTVPKCPMRFSQKTHLNIHVRSHTDERPYPCTQPGCNYRFSQLGNLKTHERRHTGEKPYPCDICGKRFAQRGNVRAHKETHNNFKRFACRIDGCTKKFSQLGNMKTHQNKFHAETIKSLTNKFATILSAGQELQGEDKELFEYFAVHYKNSNKGIKGRGKDRKVNTIVSAPPAPSSQYSGPQPSTSQHHMSHGLSYSGMAPANAFGHYNNYNMLVGRDSRREYEYDMDHDSVSGSSATGTLYEDDQHFDERFQHRLY